MVERTAIAWLRAITILVALIFLVVVANSAASWKRQSTDEERITQLEWEVQQLRAAKKAQDEFNATIIRLEESRSK